MGKYDDIIHLPHKQSVTRPHMSIENRAAQFAPFAALVGYDDAVTETARLTDVKRDLSDGMIEELNERLNILQDFLHKKPQVSITHFAPDKKKSGGAYVTTVGTVKKIDDFEGIVTLDDGSKIAIKSIHAIEGDIFDSFGNY